MGEQTITLRLRSGRDVTLSPNELEELRALLEQVRPPMPWWPQVPPAPVIYPWVSQPSTGGEITWGDGTTFRSGSEPDVVALNYAEAL